MNIHSCPRPRRPDARPRLRHGLERTDKRDALLRAAIDTFAARGFFNAQVADVARAAGVAAGTVYLYFRGKDDLLISIFERTMKEAIADGRRSVGALDRPGRAPARNRPAPPRPARARPGPGRRLSGRAQAVDEVHGTVLLDSAARIPRHHQERHRRRSGTQGVPLRRSARRWPPSCSSVPSTRWRPTGSSAVASTRSPRKPMRSWTCSSVDLGIAADAAQATGSRTRR